MEKIAKDRKLKHVSCSRTRWREGFELLSSAKLSISGRYHPTIMALCGHTPSYLVSANNCKMGGLHSVFYDDLNNFSNSHELDKDIDKICSWVEQTTQNYNLEVARVGLRLLEVESSLEQAKKLILKTLGR